MILSLGASSETMLWILLAIGTLGNVLMLVARPSDAEDK